MSESSVLDDATSYRVARLITEGLAPWVLVAALPPLLAFAGDEAVVPRLAWSLVIVTFCSLIPMGILVGALRRGKVTDHHVRVREQRPVPLLLGIGSVLVGLGLMHFGAPRDLRALTWAMLAGLVVTTVITLVWKISVHAAVAAGTVVILVLVYGPVLHVVWVAALAVAWSRVRLGDHTVAQVLGGLPMGGVVAGTVFAALAG